jgi:hypothetical protein
MPRGLGLGQHARGQVGARDPEARRGHHRKILARPARRVQDGPAGRDETEHPRHPGPLRFRGVLVLVVGGRFPVVGGVERRPEFGQPRSPVHDCSLPPQR